jgi:DNA topoisomerase II
MRRSIPFGGLGSSCAAEAVGRGVQDGCIPAAGSAANTLLWAHDGATVAGATSCVVGSVEVKYYKGLGTSTAKEAKEYFSMLDNKSTIYDGAPCDDVTDLAFSKAKVENRKNWLLQHDPATSMNFDVDEVANTDFVHKELILFSIAGNTRSTPPAVDGLFMTSQREVQFSCGRYNTNLFVPSGQFGTRIQGGKDAASPCYISTKIAPITRSIFPEADDAVLNYQEEDGNMPAIIITLCTRRTL